MIVSTSQIIELTSCCIVELSYRLIERMTHYDLELAFEMLLMEKKMILAATRIAVIYKGTMVRKKLKPVIAKRKSAIVFVQAFLRFRMILFKIK